jgi:RimJ/RimL family protein N-acetyltransferase
MLHGEQVTLRNVRQDELPTVYAWRYDVETWTQTATEPYVVPTFEQFVAEWTAPAAPADLVPFGIEADGRLVGTCALWGIDLHNRFAHVGMTVGSAEHRGQGAGRDALAVITDYGFRLRGLHRLQLETLAVNEAMVRTALSVGYQQEGRLRDKAWGAGAFSDELVFGLLAAEWHGKGG